MSLCNVDTDAEVHRFVPVIMKGNAYLRHNQSNFFGCGEFMTYEIAYRAKALESEFGPESVIIEVPHKDENQLSEKIMEWWLEIIRHDLDIQVYYIGEEDTTRFFEYTLPTGNYGIYNLCRFTLFRYAWGVPYSSIIEKLYYMDKEVVSKVDIWTLFVYLHSHLSLMDDYDETFGILFAESRLYCSSDEVFKNIFKGMQSSMGNMQSINIHFRDGLDECENIYTNPISIYPSGQQIKKYFNIQ